MQLDTVGRSGPHRTTPVELTRVGKAALLGHSEERPRDGSLKDGRHQIWQSSPPGAAPAPTCHNARIG